VAFGRNAKFAKDYLKKGMKMILSGRLQSGSYIDKQGEKVYTLQFVVEEHEFAEKKTSSVSEENGNKDISDAELPFK